MVRYLRAFVGFALISIFYSIPTVFILGLIAMGDCDRAQATSCTPMSDFAFWPAVILLAIVFVVFQALFMRWALRKADFTTSPALELPR